MDEREVHELLRRAAENVQPSPDLPERAERRYKNRRVRQRVLAAVVVLVVVGSGLTVAAAVAGDRPAGDIGPRGATSTTVADGGVVDVGNIGALTFFDADEGYGIEWVMGGDRYLVHSTDGARTWQRAGRTPAGVTALLQAPQYAGALDGLVAWGDHGLFESSDRGAHWQKTLGPSVHAVVGASFKLWATITCGSERAPSCEPRLVTSSDAGRTWTDPETRIDLRRGAEGIDIPSGGTVFLVDGEFAWSPDGGRSWAYQPEPEACAKRPTQRLAVSSHVLLLVCTSTNLEQGSRGFVSADEGRSWQAMPLLSEGTRYPPVLMASDLGFVAAIGNGPLLTTADNGASWREAFPMPAMTAVVALSRTFGVGVWAAAADQGIWFSRDGVDWERRARAGAETPQPTACFKLSPEPHLIPKPGFDPLTASDEELAAADFPPRPTDPKSLATWRRYAQKYLAGEVDSCATPAPGDIPPRARAHTNVEVGGGIRPAG